MIKRQRRTLAIEEENLRDWSTADHHRVSGSGGSKWLCRTIGLGTNRKRRVVRMDCSSGSHRWLNDHDSEWFFDLSFCVLFQSRSKPRTELSLRYRIKGIRTTRHKKITIQN